MHANEIRRIERNPKLSGFGFYFILLVVCFLLFVLYVALI